MKYFIIILLFGGLCSYTIPKSVYDFTVNTIEGTPVALSSYKGKVLLIVNTASKCGLTPQYEDLQDLYEQYKAEGFEILGFPANNFMGQEPKSNAKIKQFCQDKYQVSFPMFSKISVKGKNRHPLYTYLTTKKQNGVLNAPVTWNFQKFLIDRQGNVLASFAPQERVTDKKVLRAIQKALKSK